MHARAGHRQRMLQKAAGEGMEVLGGRGHLLELLAVIRQDGQHQSAERYVGNGRLRDGPKLLVHRLDVVASALNEIERVESLGLVLLCDGADIEDVEARPIRRVLVIAAADLVEAAALPLRSAGL